MLAIALAIIHSSCTLDLLKSPGVQYKKFTFTQTLIFACTNTQLPDYTGK